MNKPVTIHTIGACKSQRMQATVGGGDAELVIYGKEYGTEYGTFIGSIYLDNDDLVKFCQKVIQALDDYDPTPCCYQHGVGAIGTNEKCPDIADND